MKNLANLVPNFAKPLLRPLYYAVMSSRPYRIVWQSCPNLPLPPIQSGDEVRHYWKHRQLLSFSQRINELPHHETIGKAWGEFLVEKVQRYVVPEARILEVGSGIGLNLNYLFQANFKNLEGIEINKQDVQIFKQAYPEIARNIEIHNASIEEVIRGFNDYQFDLVLAKGVLRLIHPDNEWIFPGMVRITNYLITVENESLAAPLCYPRNYKEVFEVLGMRQVEEFSCGDVGLPGNNSIRIFGNGM